MAQISASGFFDSRGMFDVDLNGQVVLGTDDWGIRASRGRVFRQLPAECELGVMTLSFSGSRFRRGEGGRHYATGGAGIGIDYNGDSGKTTALADVTVLGITYDVDFTLGYILLGTSADPRLGQVPRAESLTLNVSVAVHESQRRQRCRRRRHGRGVYAAVARAEPERHW